VVSGAGDERVSGNELSFRGCLEHRRRSRLPWIRHVRACHQLPLPVWPVDLLLFPRPGSAAHERAPRNERGARSSRSW